MEANKREANAPNTEFISRLGFREISAPTTFHCLRNGEALELNIHFFENRNHKKVIYYTEAKDMQTGKIRHTATFQFNEDNDHLALHKFCLHTLFFDQTIEEDFTKENKFHPPMHLHPEKAEQFLNYVRYYWNTQCFNERYKMLGGLNSKKELISN